MTAFAIQKLPRLKEATEPCINRCTQSGDKAGLRKSASHVAWIIDRKTYLCGPCAREWSKTWEAARENFSEQVAA